MSSPNLNNIILLGCILCYLSVIVFGLESYESICQTRPWLLAIGFTLSFGSLFSKTWRVHRIYHNKHKMRVVSFTFLLHTIKFAGIAINDSKYYFCKLGYQRYAFTYHGILFGPN